MRLRTGGNQLQGMDVTNMQLNLEPIASLPYIDSHLQVCGEQGGRAACFETVSAWVA